MSTITAPVITTTPPMAQLHENLDLRKSMLNARKIELQGIIAGIAIAAILSATGVLPTAVLTGAMVGLISTAVTYIAARLVVSQIKKYRNLASDNNSQYSELVTAVPWYTCIALPIIEEVVFRAILQGSLQFILKRVLPAAVITVFGAQIPLYACAAMVVAGATFGALHAYNPHKLSKVQAVVAGIDGICVFGPLYYYYGLWASCMAHIVRNTAVFAKDAAAETKALQAEERNRAVLGQG